MKNPLLCVGIGNLNTKKEKNYEKVNISEQTKSHTHKVKITLFFKDKKQTTNKLTILERKATK